MGVVRARRADPAHLTTDPDTASNTARVTNRARVDGIVAEMLGAMVRGIFEAALTQAGGAFAVVNDMDGLRAADGAGADAVT